MSFHFSRVTTRALTIVSTLGLAAAGIAIYGGATAQQPLVNPPGVSIATEPLDLNPANWRPCQRTTTPAPGVVCEPSIQTGTPAIQAQLPDVLESEVSGTVVAFNDPIQGVAGTVKPINTFLNADGRYCRTFEAHASNEDGSLTSRGVACRDDEGKWLTRVQVNAV